MTPHTTANKNAPIAETTEALTTLGTRNIHIVPAPAEYVNPAQKFMRLFASREGASAFGTPNGRVKANGKVDYDYTTLRRSYTQEDVARHLAGQTSIVAIAIREDNTCYWASIDDDDYLHSASLIQQRLGDLKLPLHIFTSKSGGLHLMAFFREPKPARAVRRLLAGWAEQIRIGETELFPKQDAVGPEGTGNGMNLPFLGDAQGLANFEPVYCDIPVEEWPKEWPKGWKLAKPANSEAKGIRLIAGWDPEEKLSEAGLLFSRREEPNGAYSLDYYADHGKCLLWDGEHDTAPLSKDGDNPASLNRMSRFLVQPKDGTLYLSHQCFDSDCQAEVAKTPKALAALGINVEDITPQVIIGNRMKSESARGFIFTEGGNAERLVCEHGENFRYLLDDQKWLAWDGRRWKRDASAEIQAAAKATVRHMRKLAADVEDDTERDKFSKWAQTSDRRASRENMVALARYEPGVKALREEFDRHPWLLNVLNGTIDLKSGTLRPHDRADMLTQVAPVVFDPAARCPRFEQFLRETFPDPENKGVKQDVIEFIRRSLGYTLTGGTEEHKFWLLLGAGRNGKGVLLNVIKALLGDYAAETSFNTFSAKRTDSAAINPRDGLASLVGKRFVKASESGEGKRFDDALVKSITGGDAVRTAKMYGDEFEYLPQFKIWQASNVEPRVTGVDDGIWSRILRVNFDHQVPEEKRDPQLVTKIVSEELSGVLNYALGGLRDYLEGGLQVPVAVVGAVSEYRHDQNPLVEFLNARYERTAAPNDSVSLAEILKEYNDWARIARTRSLNAQSLGLAMKALQITGRRVSGGLKVCEGLKKRPTGVTLGAPIGQACGW